MNAAVNNIEIPVCVGGFALDAVENKTNCLKDASGVLRQASEVGFTFQI